MDEAVINGANLFFADQFGIGKEGDQSRNQWLLGLVNSAPYVGGFDHQCDTHTDRHYSCAVV